MSNTNVQDPKEIERRFLCLLPETLPEKCKVLKQGYLLTGDVSIRVRRSDDEFTITRKEGEGKVRPEREREIDSDVGEMLLEAAGDRVIDKIRLPYGRWELDIFRGKLHGLIILEVELSHEDEELPPLPSELEPYVLGEVTGINWLSNAHLAELSGAQAYTLVQGIYASRKAQVPQPGQKVGSLIQMQKILV